MGGRRDGGGRIVRRLALLGVLLVLSLFGAAGSASAHAALTGTDPLDGSVVKTAPQQITLTFSESVGLLDDSIRVVAPDNRRVRTGSPGHVGGSSATARVTLPRDLGTGTFTVAWRVVSADSHPVCGALTFSVGKPSATSAVLPSDPAGDTVSAVLHDIARYVAYVALALLLGTVAFVLVTGVRAVRTLLLTGWWTLLLSTVALLLLRGPYERGSTPAAAFDPSVLGATVTSRPGAALLARLVLLAVAALLPLRDDGSAVRGPGWARSSGVLVGCGVLAVGLAGTWAAAEHASAGIQVPVALVSAVLHLLAMAVWLGGLTALLTALYRAPEDLPAAAVTRFSRLAFTAVAVLVVTGVYQSWRGLGSWDALTSTSYGRILVAKLAAVLLLLAAAAYSRRWTTRMVTAAERVRVAVPEPEPVPVGGGPVRVDSGGRPGPEPGQRGVYRRALRRSVLVEVTVGVVVLVITTVLTGTQPGRAAEETAASAAAAGQPAGAATVIPFDVGTPGGHGKVQIELDPGRVGANTVQAVISGPDGGIATVPELRLTFTLADQKIGPLDARLVDEGGYWGSDSVNLPLSGTWTMNATVRTTDIDQVTVSKTVKIG